MKKLEYVNGGFVGAQRAGGVSGWRWEHRQAGEEKDFGLAAGLDRLFHVTGNPGNSLTEQQKLKAVFNGGSDW